MFLFSGFLLCHVLVLDFHHQPRDERWRTDSWKSPLNSKVNDSPTVFLNYCFFILCGFYIIPCCLTLFVSCYIDAFFHRTCFAWAEECPSERENACCVWLSTSITNSLSLLLLINGHVYKLIKFCFLLLQ